MMMQEFASSINLCKWRWRIIIEIIALNFSFGRYFFQEIFLFAIAIIEFSREKKSLGLFDSIIFSGEFWNVDTLLSEGRFLEISREKWLLLREDDIFYKSYFGTVPVYALGRHHYFQLWEKTFASLEESVWLPLRWQSVFEAEETSRPLPAQLSNTCWAGRCNTLQTDYIPPQIPFVYFIQKRAKQLELYSELSRHSETKKIL